MILLRGTREKMILSEAEKLKLGSGTVQKLARGYMNVDYDLTALEEAEIG